MLTYEQFNKIKVRHLNSIYSSADKFTSYKNISIHFALQEIAFRGDWFQFGVFKGHTARILESYILPGQKLHLFDSFEGLPEEWVSTPYGAGHFRLDDSTVPIFDQQRTVVHRGWFEDTLPLFVRDYGNKIPFVHLDADLYSSTKTVLGALNKNIVPETILLFDEFFLPSEKGLSEDEARAFFEWADEFDREFQILWRTEWVQCAIRILS